MHKVRSSEAYVTWSAKSAPLYHTFAYVANALCSGGIECLCVRGCFCQEACLSTNTSTRSIHTYVDAYIHYTYVIILYICKVEWIYYMSEWWAVKINVAMQGRHGGD